MSPINFYFQGVAKELLKKEVPLSLCRVVSTHYWGITTTLIPVFLNNGRGAWPSGVQFNLIASVYAGLPGDNFPPFPYCPLKWMLRCGSCMSVVHRLLQKRAFFVSCPLDEVYLCSPTVRKWDKYQGTLVPMNIAASVFFEQCNIWRNFKHQINELLYQQRSPVYYATSSSVHHGYHSPEKYCPKETSMELALLCNKGE